MTDDEIEAAFRAAVEAYRALPSKISLPSAIFSLTGHKVLPIELANIEDKALIATLNKAVATCMRSLADDPIISGRVNEVGNLFEPRMKRACETVGLAAQWPTDAQGRAGRSGYPDLVIFDRSGRPTYLEVKTVGPGQEATSFRSFYLSPSDRPKICHDARHLLVAFAHAAGATSEAGREYRATAYKIVDLATVSGNIKFEYQSSNKRLYQDECVLTSGNM